MDKLILGAYWKNRALTLRQYVDSVRGFLALLRELHPVFSRLEWVGDRPNSAVEISSDLANLEEIILRHSWDKRDLKGSVNADGAPAPSATNQIGFQIMFATKDWPGTDVTISIGAGALSSVLSNAVVIEFRDGNGGSLLHSEFFGYDFLKELFGRIIQYWKPDTALVTLRDFAKRVCPDGPSKAGWLTYAADPRAAKLASRFATEALEVPGTVFTLGRQGISAENADQVATAIKLKDALQEMKSGHLAGA